MNSRFLLQIIIIAVILSGFIRKPELSDEDEYREEYYEEGTDTFQKEDICVTNNKLGKCSCHHLFHNTPQKLQNLKKNVQPVSYCYLVEWP